ncbi:CBN-RUVB-2 protein [Caenorhabditis brenneri]|uniref:RuvB-like helicase n=1 Tax=Caenorhabditis brenneri TaxID=135651 RepID=G0P8I4_CAEBE|nr:CBN-RUVB-2 protein [Caenorhabditis brenneri]
MLDGINVKDIVKVERTSVHSHITGLGLNHRLEADYVAGGMVGQVAARQAAGLIVKMIQEGKIAGRALLVTGEPGAGKTALAIAISKELGVDTPFVSIVASEIYSTEINKTEALTQAFRRALGLQIKEETEVLEGEVISLEVDRPSNGLGPKVGKLTMRTTDMETIYDLGSKMVDACIKEQIIPGDVIQVDKASGRVTRLGRSFNRSHDYDAMGPKVKLVQCPDGEIQKRRETVHTVCLHDIDVINSRTQGYVALFSGDTGEIKAEVRDQINKKVLEWREEGKAKFVPGVLFIDEAHMLDIECFSFLNRAIEGELSPLIIMATNRLIEKVRGTDVESAHGIPSDFLDRMLIINALPYTQEDTTKILQLRCDEEGVKLDSNALDLLVKLQSATSLRYCIHLIAAAEVIRIREKKETVATDHVSQAYRLFFDTKRSEKMLSETDGYLQ